MAAQVLLPCAAEHNLVRTSASKTVCGWWSSWPALNARRGTATTALGARTVLRAAIASGRLRRARLDILRSRGKQRGRSNVHELGRHIAFGHSVCSVGYVKWSVAVTMRDNN